MLPNSQAASTLAGVEPAIMTCGLKTLKTFAQQYIRPLEKESSQMSDRSVDVRAFSERTIAILQVLASTNQPLKAKKIASFVKAPYKSVHKTLRRLLKKGLVNEDRKCFFTSNHHGPMLFSDLLGDVSMLELHRIGLKANILDLDRHVVAAGRCMPWEWKKGIGSRPKSLVKKADMRLMKDSAYYQEGCEPFPIRNLMHRYRDFMDSLDYYTKELADVQSVYLNDYESGRDIPFDMFFWDMLGVSRIEIYRLKGRNKGKLRIHVQCSKRHHRLPPDDDTELRIETDFITMLDEARMLIDQTFQTLLAASTLQRNTHQK